MRGSRRPWCRAARAAAFAAILVVLAVPWTASAGTPSAEGGTDAVPAADRAAPPVRPASTVILSLDSPFNYAAIPPGTPIRLAVNGTGFDEVRYALDGGAAQPLSASYEIATDGWSAGTHIVAVEALAGTNVLAADAFVFFVDPDAVWPMDRVAVDVVLVGFEVPAGDVAAGLVPSFVRTVPLTPEPGTDHTFELAFDFTVREAGVAYQEALVSYLRSRAAYREDLQAKLNHSALEDQYLTDTPRDIFDPLVGYELQDEWIDEYLAANPPLPPGPGPGYAVYLLNLSGLDDPAAGIDHWIVREARDPDTNRTQDWWRLEWDNDLNTPMGYPLNAYGGPDHRVVADPTAYQWYQDWAWIWWRGESGRAPWGYQYEETDPADRATYLARVVNDLVAGLAAALPWAPPTEPGIEIRNYVLSGSASQTPADLMWTVSDDVLGDYLRAFLPFRSWELNTSFGYVDDFVELQAVVDGNTTFTGTTGRIDGEAVWTYLDGNRTAYVPDDPGVFEILTVNLVYDNRSMVLGGREFTGLGGSGTTAIFLQTDRLFDGAGAPQKGLTSVISHETGHNLGYGHQFGPSYRADFIDGNMGYFRNELEYGAFWEDALLRVYVRAKLLRVLELLDGREPVDLLPEFQAFYRDYRSLDLLAAYAGIANLEAMLLDPNPPVADAGPDRNVEVATPVLFDASGSSDTFRILNYTWDLGDGRRTTAASPTLSTSWAAAGTFIVTLTARDAAGNEGKDTAFVTVVEPGGPTLEILAPASGSYEASSAIEVRWSAAPGDSTLDRIEIRLDAGSAVTLPAASASHTYTGLVDGSHTVRVDVFDARGSSATATTTFTVDTVPPTLALTAPPNGAVLNASNVRVTWDAADATSGLDRFELSLDGGSPVSLAANVRERTFLIAEEGGHEVNLTAFDRVGHQDSAVVALSVDVAPPVLTIDAPPGGAVTGDSVEVRWTASDAIAGIDRFEIVLDNGSPVVLPASARTYRLEGLAPGPHRIALTAWDVAGNARTESVQVSVRQDGPPPPGGDLLPYVVAGSGIAAASAGAAVLVRRRRRSRPPSA